MFGTAVLWDTQKDGRHHKKKEFKKCRSSLLTWLTAFLLLSVNKVVIQDDQDDSSVVSAQLELWLSQAIIFIID